MTNKKMGVWDFFDEHPYVLLFFGLICLAIAEEMN